jgi:Domain of unknown function (DUF1835)/Protein of unknown function
MFHIVFDSRGAELLNAAMDLDEALDGEVILIQDDYSVGPIQDLFSDEGRAERKKWWDEIRQAAGETGVEESDSGTLMKILQRMGEEEFDQIWIWMAPNTRDVSGYFWLIAQLKEFSGRIYLLSLNNLPFINEKGNVFYPVSLAEIPAREFVKAKKLARPVSLSEFETDPDEWWRLAAENKNLRMLEGGKKIVQQSDDYYDKQIMHFIQPAFQKIQRTMHQILQKSSEKLNETFLNWRLKQLIASGLAEQQGETIRLVVKASDEVESVEVDG